MNKTTLIIIIAIVVLAAFGYIFYQSSQQQIQDGVLDLEPINTAPFEPKIIITAKHQFLDGVHLVAGDIDMPTPCDLLEWDVVILESFPEQVIIQFKTVNKAEICAQVITPARFRVEFEADGRASITATLNNDHIILNLIEVSESENLDDFEIFIKG